MVEDLKQAPDIWVVSGSCSLARGSLLPLVFSFLLQVCVAAFLDVVIGGRAVETPPMSSLNLLEGLSRTVMYMTQSQLIALVNSILTLLMLPLLS